MLNGIELAERRILPDWMIRIGIRQRCGQKLQLEMPDHPEYQQNTYQALVQELRNSPIALASEESKEQHYEVPTAFFRYVLGNYMKYSSCYWGPDENTLEDAENKMLEMTCQRAEITNGQHVLDLGCGWGSFTLWAARHYPSSQFTAISNSATQREYILSQADKRGLTNVAVITSDINDFQMDEPVDRVVSVEMFEHVRNYELLMARISQWLKPDGKLFVHHFCHRILMYPYVIESDDDWMGRHFFTGGMMPAGDTLLNFQQHLKLAKRWYVNGEHYEKTLNTWLEQMDQHEDAIREIFIDTYGKSDAERWIQRWRIFFMACAELFGYAGGKEWMVGHYLFEQVDQQSTFH
ncbi:MAG: cyclopropane-fatty-acyl-phospholipid synthase family protein [Pseudomonadota bacterium]